MSGCEIMTVTQETAKKVLSKHMMPGQWYQLKELHSLFEDCYDDWTPDDYDPINSKKEGHPQWYWRVKNSVRMSPGRPDFTSNDWPELRTRKLNGGVNAYSIVPVDPLEEQILNSLTSREDDGSGFVYAIINESFGDNWVKIGMTFDLDQRLSQYQVYSPYQNYRVIHSVHVYDRRVAECRAHFEASKWTETDPSGEWFNIGEEKALEVLQFVRGLYPC